MSSQEVVDFVKEKLKLPENKERLSKICEEVSITKTARKQGKTLKDLWRSK